MTLSLAGPQPLAELERPARRFSEQLRAGRDTRTAARRR